MILNLQFESIGAQHVDAAVRLALSMYQEEKEAIPFLPDTEDFEGILRRDIANLFAKGTGVAALANGELVGYIAGWEIKEFWGYGKGFYSPLYGHGAIKERRRRVYEEMYRHAAKLWVKKEYVTHALTFFAQDKETIDTWFWLGFGLRCVDGIRQATPIEDVNPELVIKKAEVEDLPDIAEMNTRLVQYLNESPLFMPRRPGDSLKNLTEGLEEEGHHIWIAYHEGTPLGYMEIQPIGETYISEHPAIMHVSGAYVPDDQRRGKIGVTILDAIQRWLMENGYPLCGVDFESFNPTGGRFWTKHFIPYTFSLVRRIDERIIPLLGEE